jgi:putative membrane protein
VTVEPPRPRIEAEPLPSPRLESEILLTPPLPQRRANAMSLVASGVGLLLAGFAALETVNFVVAQFARSTLLGGFTAAVAVSGFALIGAGVARELTGLFRLRSVDRLRAELAGPEPLRAKGELRRWLARLPEGATTAAALERINDPDAMLALLRAGPLARMRSEADALARMAALQIFAAAAAVPSPALEGVLFAWRGIRLVRQVGTLYGVRPGLLGTWSLLQRTALAAVGVAATDLAADTVVRALVSNPLLRHVAGDVAAAGVAARRMLVLARAAAAACSPVPPG